MNILKKYSPISYACNVFFVVAWSLTNSVSLQNVLAVWDS